LELPWWELPWELLWLHKVPSWGTRPMWIQLHRPRLHSGNTSFSSHQTSPPHNCRSQPGNHNSFSMTFGSTIPFWPQTSRFSSWRSPPRSQSNANFGTCSTTVSCSMTSRGPNCQLRPDNRSSPCCDCCSTSSSFLWTSQSPSCVPQRCSRTGCLGNPDQTQSSRTAS